MFYAITKDPLYYFITKADTNALYAREDFDENTITFKTRKQAEKYFKDYIHDIEIRSTNEIKCNIYYGEKWLHVDTFDNKNAVRKHIEDYKEYYRLPDDYKISFSKSKFDDCYIVSIN